MKIFGLDTTRKSAKVFICDDEKNIEYVVTMDEKIRHSEGLFLYIEKALSDTKMELSDFDILSAVVGPGSFTGIRVGMSAIKGINKVLNKTIIPMNMFEVLLSTINKEGVVLLNSTNTSCYFAYVKKGEICESGVIEKNEILTRFNGVELVLLKEELNLIGLEYNNIRVVDDIANQYFQTIKSKYEISDKSDFVPYYLQLSQAERNLKNE